MQMPKFICIEGLDGTGKNTIARTLVDVLTQQGWKVQLWSFPDYESPTGIIVRNALNGVYGDFVKMSPEFCSEIYAIDRLAYIKEHPVDDDIDYPCHLLRDLLRLHKRLPDAIIAHRVRRMKLSAPYSEWRKYKWYDFIFKRIHFSRLAMQTGVGGVLYPPHSLDEKMLDPVLFMAMAPTVDDVWFWAAAVSKGTYVVPIPNGKSRAKEVGKPKEYSLKTINLQPGDDRNREALHKILEHFPEIKQRIEHEK